MSKTYIIVFGPPGSGKGTQAKKIGERLKLPIVSTGDLLRKEIEFKTEIGKKAQKIMKQGGYVPKEVVDILLLKRLKKADAKAGAIFDGYPRTEEQQEFLIKKLSKNNKMLGILVDVSDKEIKKRLGGRRACICGHIYHLKFNPPKKAGKCDLCGGKLFVRNDDKPEVIKQRLNIYHEQTEPLIKYWAAAESLVKVDGEQKIDKVFKDITSKLKKFIQ